MPFKKLRNDIDEQILTTKEKQREISARLQQNIEEFHKEWEKYSKARKQFGRDYHASKRRVDATRKDIDKWTAPQIRNQARQKTT